MTPLDEVPSVINAGDSYDLLLEEPHYPASAGWSLRLVLNGPSSLTKDSVASGDQHALTLTTTNTTGLAAGLYRFVVKAINGAAVTTVRDGFSEVKPDLATAPAGTLASWAEQALAAVEAALLGAASDEMRMFMIDGRQVQKYSFDELLRLRGRLKSEIAGAQGYFGVPIVMTATGFSS